MNTNVWKCQVYSRKIDNNIGKSKMTGDKGIKEQNYREIRTNVLKEKN